MDTHTPNKPLLIAPLAAGILSMCLLTLNSLYRTGILRTGSLGGFVQNHFHLIGGAAALSSMFGLVLAFVLPKSYRDYNMRPLKNVIWVV